MYGAGQDDGNRINGADFQIAKLLFSMMRTSPHAHHPASALPSSVPIVLFSIVQPFLLVLVELRNSTVASSDGCLNFETAQEFPHYQIALIDVDSFKNLFILSKER